MNQEEIINNISEIINYSNLSHKLKINQLITFNMGFKYGRGTINLLPYDIFELISKYVRRNSWKNTKKIIKRIKK
jgi:hypothetical protein